RPTPRPAQARKSTRASRCACPRATAAKRERERRKATMNGIHKLLLRAFLALVLAAGLGGVALGAGTNIDLVGDDTDLFTTNPSIPAQVPNVLIVLDNSANWSRSAQQWPATLDPYCSNSVASGGLAMTGNQQGDAEVCAIALTIKNLNS